MIQQLLALVLPLLLWGAVSGVLNLILTRKSQIEAWVNANPRLAAWSKFLRSVGFDPWALHAWATLLVSKKLPAAQQADSDVAKLEQRKAEDDARRKGPPDDPDTTVSLMPEPVKLVAQDRSRLHNDRPEPPEAAEFRSWDWRPALLLALLFAVVTQPACSAFRSVTPADRAEAYAAEAKAVELACKAYRFDLAAGLTPDVPAMAKLCAGGGDAHSRQGPHRDRDRRHRGELRC